MSNNKSLQSRPPLARMLKLHEELQAGRHPNCRRMGEALEVSSKTIQRDLEFMRDQLGLPIEYDGARFGYGYTEPVGHFPTVQVSEGEVVALFVAQKALQQYQGTSLERPLAGAFEKIAGSLKDEVSLDLTDWDRAISFRAAGGGGGRRNGGFPRG
ncbi:MAG: HTH domain-containing protein [Bacteroidales bacterium]|nr:HTH domain-containing protein [Bacteroidales bacterium]